jgi:hypothetical protein
MLIVSLVGRERWDDAAAMTAISTLLCIRRFRLSQSLSTTPYHHHTWIDRDLCLRRILIASPTAPSHQRHTPHTTHANRFLYLHTHISHTSHHLIPPKIGTTSLGYHAYYQIVILKQRVVRRCLFASHPSPSVCASRPTPRPLLPEACTSLLVHVLSARHLHLYLFNAYPTYPPLYPA